FNVGMIEIGLLFGTWSISSLIGSTIGGALADKFGRKIILIFGLLFSAGAALFMGFVSEFRVFYLVAIFGGIFSDIGHPAQQAMVADLLKGEQRSEGFSVLRVVANLAVTIGPAIGGLLAGVSYLLLFILDACASTITALIVLKTIPETKPERSADHPAEPLLTTLAGYGKVIKDRFFMAFIFASIIMIIVYIQMYSTLSVFLYKVHDIPAKGFGFMMSMNAAMVVLFQFWITRKIKKYQPMVMMIAASILYGIGFSMFGFVGSFVLFMLAMAIITIGEMVHIPTAQALVAYFAPEDMRARYMAAFGYTWAIPNAVAPLLAGLVMDNYDPRWVWYLAGLLSLVAAGAFTYLYYRTKHKFAKPVRTEMPPLQPI
ncbi:MAG: MFS transporter, partial [Anaerolineaceae bacterium]|nr:MFS transporter [Anaerolineaceae bacterium]